jgi:hypothetical protein
MRWFRNWIRKRYLAHPTMSTDQWEDWSNRGHFMLMGRKWPMEIWCACDSDDMVWPESFSGPDGVCEVREWINKQPNPDAFRIVLIEGRFVK